MPGSCSAGLCVVNRPSERKSTHLHRCDSTTILHGPLFHSASAYVLTFRRYTHIVGGVPAIDHKSLTKAMGLAPMTAKQLADKLGLSLQYVCDIQAGRRTLKRNPELRKRIAEALDIPTHWIEHRDEPAEVA